jgi:hypothetical protein
VICGIGVVPIAITGVTVTVTDDLMVGNATLVTVTVALVWAETLGATKSPVLEIVPRLADQVTCCWVALITVAVNLSFEPEATVAVVGATEIVMVKAPADDASAVAETRMTVENRTSCLRA